MIPTSLWNEIVDKDLKKDSLQKCAYLCPIYQRSLIYLKEKRYMLV